MPGGGLEPPTRGFSMIDANDITKEEIRQKANNAGLCVSNVFDLDCSYVEIVRGKEYICTVEAYESIAVEKFCSTFLNLGWQHKARPDNDLSQYEPDDDYLVDFDC
ncbi:MAG: hypothetical protein AAGJ80_13770 [Cyanobacteria bacterium J06553_1]